MKNFVLTSLLIILFGYTAHAQAGITAGELENHISFLASDELKGRKTGTADADKAADYIRKEYKKYHLQLLGEDGFQYFNVTTGVELGDKNTLTVDGKNFVLGNDFSVLPFSGNGTVSANVIFAGYGFNFKVDTFSWNDYEKIDVKGKWVLILRGDPEYDKNESLFVPYSSDRAKTLTAQDLGAAGVLFVSPENIDKEDKLSTLKTDKRAAQMKIPVLHISRQTANILLSKSGFNIDLMAAEINLSRKPFSHNITQTVTATSHLNITKMKTQNVIGMIQGSDNNHFIIIGAHYDHLGFGGPGSGSRMPDTIAIHNGADDNASGVASILELAEDFSQRKTLPAVNLIFVAFSGEEIGLLGSAFFVNNPLVDKKQILAMINLDMVGRLDTQTPSLSIIGTGTAVEFDKILSKYQEKVPFKMVYSPGGFGASDQASFYGENIPVLFFNTGGHDDYHTPFDDTEKINFKGQQEITRYIFQVVDDISKYKQLTFVQVEEPDQSKRNVRGFKVTLGIMPNTSNESSEGMKVDAVRKGGPAEKGGLMKNDLITAINGKSIANVYDYMQRLAELKQGDVILVDILRDGKKNVLTIQL